MSKFSTSSFVAGAVVATVFAAVPVAAAVRAADSSRYDQTAPTLTVKPMTFDVGSSIDITPQSSDPCDLAYHNKIPMHLTWTASDTGGGIAGYDVFTEVGLSENPYVLDTQATSVAVMGKTYPGGCGGEAYFAAPAVAAKDRNGNVAVSGYNASNIVPFWQEDGTGNPTGTEWRGMSVSKTAGWSVSNCKCYDAGHTLFATAKGISINYSITTQAGETFAVVMEKNTNRGQASMSVDGGPGVVVDTFASTAQHGAIVWQTTLTTAGPHTFTVTNLATGGRPRIDVDAVMKTWQHGGGPYSSGGLVSNVAARGEKLVRPADAPGTGFLSPHQ